MLTNKKTKLNIFILLMVVAIAGTAAGQTIYVDAGATGSNDGSNWANAYNYLQDALANAVSGDEIWVAAGIYKPDQGGGITAGDRDAAFELSSGVAIYAGFPSGGGAWEDRDMDAFETVLSGDLDGDDAEVTDPQQLLTEPTRVENSYQVVFMDSITDATIDGFTITGGNATGVVGHIDSSGAGIYCNYVDETNRISNCRISSNFARMDGGGVFAFRSSLLIISCTISNNSAGSTGGGLSVHGGAVTVANCTISGNWASVVGGVFFYYGSTVITNCSIIGNKGSGVFCLYDSSHIIANTIIVGNYDGILEYPSNVDSLVINCLFHDNQYDYTQSDYAHVRTSYNGADAINMNVAGASNNIDGDPMFVEAGNWDGSTWVDGDYHLLPESPCIDAGDNAAVPALVVTDLDGNPRFVDCPDIPDTGNGTPPIVDIGTYEMIVPVTQVAIDIKPGSYPNAINLGSYGLVPVAILSSDEFDATSVDPESVELAGAGVAVRGKSNKYMAHKEDVNGDGLLDLMVQVATENLEPDSFQDGWAILTGNLLEEFGGTLIEGTDEITIVPKE
jgi:hypothetical protein